MNSSPSKHSAKHEIVCIGPAVNLLHLQAALLRANGYSATAVNSLKDLEAQLAARPIEIAILDFTMNQSERKTYAQRIKQISPETAILVLHSSGAQGNELVDLAIDSREGTEAVLQAVTHLLMLRRIRSHQHPGFEGDYLVYADRDRRLLEVTERVCTLLGYRRSQLLGRSIDDISHVPTHRVSQQFEEYVNAGAQEGEFLLRHRSGNPIKIKYTARVFEDGCMIAKWEPISS